MSEMALKCCTWSSKCQGHPCINVVVQLRSIERMTVTFLKFGIPMKAVDEKLDKIMRDSRIYFVRHQHKHGRWRDPCSLLRSVNGPFTTNFIPQNSVVAAIGSFVYCFLRDSPTCLVCDFSLPLLNWVYEDSFPSSFYVIPFETLTLDEKIYIFGCNGSSEKWSDRVSLILASAGQKALVWREDYRLPLQQYEYDPQYLRWNLFDQKGVLSHICAIVGKPITVEENTSIYWVDRKCKIWAFNYGNSKLYMGSIIGLAHEAAFRQGIECTVQLLHLKEQVFCLIWVDVCNRDVYYLHQTLVRLSRVPSWESSSPLDSIHRFYVAVMDCFHYRINSLVQIDNVFKW